MSISSRSLFLPAWFNLSLLLVISLCIAPPSADATVSKVFAIGAQSTPDEILPCTTSGFLEETHFDYPLPDQNNTRFHRVDRYSTGSKIGFVVTTDSVSGERWILTYDGRSMQTISRTRIQLAGDLDFANSANLAGEVVNGSLYLFRMVNGTKLGCAAPGGNPCVSISKYDWRGNLLGFSVVGSINVQNIDDARMNGDSSLLLLHSDGSMRYLMLFSVPGASFIAQSAALGIAANGELAINADNGFQYVAFYDAAKSIKRLAVGGTTVLGSTGNWAYSLNNILGAIMPLNLGLLGNYIVGYSTSVGGIAAQENYRGATSLADVGTISWTAPDGSAENRSTFWDNVNNKVYSWRSTGQILRATVFSGTVEQRYTCPSGVACAATNQPTKDFILKNGRLYVAANTAPGIGTVTRIKVCATGGPPA